MAKLSTKVNRFNVALAEGLLDVMGSMGFFYATLLFNAYGLYYQPWGKADVLDNISNAIQLQLISLTLWAASRSEARQRRTEAELRKGVRQLCIELIDSDPKKLN